MFVYSLLQHPFCFTNIHSFVTFAADERIDNIPITATHILSCLLVGISGGTQYFISVHGITYPAGACTVCLFQCLIGLPMDQGISQVLVPSIGHNWRFLNAFAILSDLCSTGRCFLTLLWMSGRCLEKVSTNGTLSSFFSLFFILRRSSRFSISTF